MSDVVIRATGLGKSYTRYKSRWAMLLDRLQGTTKRGEQHWALKDVSFEVKKGEFFGVIGRNGAGKSTLLQLLAGVLQPTEGTLEVKGKVLALLELGASFDPLSTGRENARLQMALFGIPAEQVDEKLKEIAEFAEIGEAFEEPVRTYSSGMFVRLAFAVNTVLEPDVLLVDEALAVGDVFFQQRCFRRLRALVDKGCTIVLTTHDLSAAQDLVSRLSWFDQGKVAAVGRPVEVIDRYVSSMPKVRAVPREGESFTGAVVRSVRLVNLDGENLEAVEQGSKMELVVRHELLRAVEAAIPGFEVTDSRGRRVHARTLLHDDVEIPLGLAPQSALVVRHRFHADLAPGPYTVWVGMTAVPLDIAARRYDVDPAEVWSRAEILSRSGEVASFNVCLPPHRRPFREAFTGVASLRGESFVEVTT